MVRICGVCRSSDRRDRASAPPHPAASHVSVTVGDDVGKYGRRTKTGCELLLWQTDRGGDLLVSRIGCKWLEVGLDLHDDQ